MTHAGFVAATRGGDSSTQESPPCHALAIDIGGTKTLFALVSDTGEILEQFRVETPLAGTDAELASEWLADQVGFAERAFAPAILDHCVIVRPGSVADASIVAMSPNTPALNDHTMAATLRSVLGRVPVWFENDVRAAAYAELRLGALKDADPGLYVNLGTGIAAALVVAGRIVQGAHNLAGEIGYMSPQASVLHSPDAARDVAPLEQLIGGTALDRRAGHLLGNGSNARDLFISEMPTARAVSYEMAVVLASALGNLCTLVDPRRIVFGGGMVGSFDTWGPMVDGYLRSSLPVAPELAVSAHLQDGSIRGAALLAATHSSVANRG